MNNFLEKARQNFYNIQKRQNIMWNLIDNKIIEEETEIVKPYKVKERKKVKAKLELETK